MRKSMPTSARFGIFSRVSVSLVSSEAIIKGSAAFLAPEILMTPFNVWPPTIRIRSKEHPVSKKSELVLFCAGLVLNAFALSRFAFGRVPRLFPPVYLLRLAAAKVRPQCLGEAMALGGFARTGCTRQNRIYAFRPRPVIGAGQAHDFVFQDASPNSPRLRRKDGVPSAGGRAESLVERHGGQGKARICGAQGPACRMLTCRVGGS